MIFLKRKRQFFSIKNVLLFDRNGQAYLVQFNQKPLGDKIRLALKKLPREKRSSLFCKSVTDGEKVCNKSTQMFVYTFGENSSKLARFK
jgi:hypothetical protein